jgi:hypothetical protein
MFHFSPNETVTILGAHTLYVESRPNAHDYIRAFMVFIKALLWIRYELCCGAAYIGSWLLHLHEMTQGVNVTLHYKPL